MDGASDGCGVGEFVEARTGDDDAAALDRIRTALLGEGDDRPAPLASSRPGSMR